MKQVEIFRQMFENRKIFTALFNNRIIRNRRQGEDKFNKDLMHVRKLILLSSKAS